MGLTPCMMWSPKARRICILPTEAESSPRQKIHHLFGIKRNRKTNISKSSWNDWKNFKRKKRRLKKEINILFRIRLRCSRVKTKNNSRLCMNCWEWLVNKENKELQMKQSNIQNTYLFKWEFVVQRKKSRPHLRPSSVRISASLGFEPELDCRWGFVNNYEKFQGIVKNYEKL